MTGLKPGNKFRHTFSGIAAIAVKSFRARTYTADHDSEELITADVNLFNTNVSPPIVCNSFEFNSVNSRVVLILYLYIFFITLSYLDGQCLHVERLLQLCLLITEI